MKRCMWTLAAIPALIVSTAHAVQPAASRVEVAQAVHQDTLPSLRAVVPDPAGYDRWHMHAEHRIPLPYTPPGQVDGAVQNFEAPVGLFAPTFISGVDGVGKGFSGPQRRVHRAIRAARHGRCGRRDAVRAGRQRRLRRLQQGDQERRLRTRADQHAVERLRRPVPDRQRRRRGRRLRQGRQPLDHLAVRGRHDAVSAVRRGLADIRCDRRAGTATRSRTAACSPTTRRWASGRTRTTKRSTCSPATRSAARSSAPTTAARC